MKITVTVKSDRRSKKAAFELEDSLVLDLLEEFVDEVRDETLAIARELEEI